MTDDAGRADRAARTLRLDVIVTIDLTTYFEACAEARTLAVADTLRGMNPRERRLVAEAAVMGYVRGMMAAHAGATEPGTHPKVVEVVDACLSMPDLYPTMTRVLRVGQKRRAAL